MLKDLEQAVYECHKILWVDYSPSQRKRAGLFMGKIDLEKALVTVKKKKGNNYPSEWYSEYE